VVPTFKEAFGFESWLYIIALFGSGTIGALRMATIVYLDELALISRFAAMANITIPQILAQILAGMAGLAAMAMVEVMLAAIGIRDGKAGKEQKISESVTLAMLIAIAVDIGVVVVMPMVSWLPDGLRNILDAFGALGVAIAPPIVVYLTSWKYGRLYTILKELDKSAHEEYNEALRAWADEFDQWVRAHRGKLYRQVETEKKEEQLEQRNITREVRDYLRMNHISPCDVGRDGVVTSKQIADKLSLKSGQVRPVVSKECSSLKGGK
jgi:hypothetical protein